jgi:hypothetical protein
MPVLYVWRGGSSAASGGLARSAHERRLACSTVNATAFAAVHRAAPSALDGPGGGDRRSADHISRVGTWDGARHFERPLES